MQTLCFPIPQKNFSQYYSPDECFPQEWRKEFNACWTIFGVQTSFSILVVKWQLIINKWQLYQIIF